MATVRVYSTAFCPYCVMAKRLLDSKGVVYQEIRVDQDLERRSEMMTLSGRRTVPQIFVGDTHVGGFDDLSLLDRAGGLDPLLASA
jgi:glutaredoxin 3